MSPDMLKAAGVCGVITSKLKPVLSQNKSINSQVTKRKTFLKSVEFN